ncbi:MAG: hypothetical protein ACXVCQ_19205 [Bacteriovorax sp.]
MQVKNLAITEKPIAVNRCVMAIAVPLTENGYRTDRSEPREKKDFSHFIEPFPLYQEKIISPVTRTIKILETAGVSIFTEVSLSDFSQLFDGRFDVIILFTHSCKQRIEFRDGLSLAENVVDQIPKEFEGIIDLSICHPTELVKTIDRILPNVVCHYINELVTPIIWMQYFIFIFKHLLDNPNINYLRASEMAHSNLKTLIS